MQTPISDNTESDYC